MVDDFNPQGTGWFVDAPSGDVNLDNLFPNPEGDGQHSPAPASDSQPPAESFFLKTPTGTVYKTAEDAVEGIAHKDNLIAQMREESIKRTGYDPIAKKQVSQPETHRTPEPQASSNQPVVYSQSPKQFWDDLVTAAQKGDYESYMRIQAQLVNEQFAPYAPMIAGFARTAAAEQVSSQFPEFKKFYHSDQYDKTLNAIPLLKEAIGAAESNPQMAQQLEQLYKAAYLAAQGLRLSEAPTGEPPRVATPDQQPPRQTLSSGQLPPPNTQPRNVYDTSTRDGRSEQRKATIAYQIAQ